MRDLTNRPDLCAINTATFGYQLPIEHSIEAIARAGFGGIAPWRREVEGKDVRAISRRIFDAKLKVTGYCRSTYMPALNKAEFQKNVDANLRALDDAALLEAESFVMVVGSLPLGSKDITLARAQVADGVALLLDHGRKVGVKIALEPLHPVYAADRSCLSLLSEALDMCDAIEGKTAMPMLGVCIDAYHVWWDPNLRRDIERARGRIFGFHVCDWLVPTKDVLNDRGMMGDGVIDLQALRRMVEGTGYTGLVETEIFSTGNWWKKPMAETLKIVKERMGTAF